MCAVNRLEPQDRRKVSYPSEAKLKHSFHFRLSLRASNYGTRLDYILVTPALLPWMKASDILPKVLGSDHCPVYVDLHDEIDIDGRGKVNLWDELNPAGKERSPPPFSTRFYEEFSGRQKLLSSFFGIGGAAKKRSAPVEDEGSASEGRKRRRSVSTATEIAQDDGTEAPTLADAFEALKSGPTEVEGSPSIVASQQAEDLDLPKMPENEGGKKAESGAGDVRDAAAKGSVLKRIASASATSNQDLTKPPSDKASSSSMSSTSTKAKTKTKTSSSTTNSSTKTKLKGGKDPNLRGGQQTLAGFFSQPKPAHSAKAEGNGKKNGKVEKTAGGDVRLSKDAKGKGKGKEKEKEQEVIEIVQTDEDEGIEEDKDVDDEVKGIWDTAQSRDETSSDPKDGLKAPSEDDEDPPPPYLDLGLDFEPSSGATPSPSSYNSEASAVWSALFTRPDPPLCSMHGEPAKEYTVNKPGVNKGRKFWLCRRHVGEGYDKGQNRDRVNPEFRCNFFK